MFRTVPLSVVGSFSLYAQQWYMSYRFADSLRAGSGWNLMNLYGIYHCCVYPDDGQRNCLKHVEFQSKNKFEKLVHLVGFIIRLPRCTVTLTSNQTKPLLNPQCSANTVPFQHYQLSINKIHGFNSLSSMYANCMKHKDHFLMNKPKHLENGICKRSPHRCTFNTEPLHSAKSVIPQASRM